LQGNAMKPSAKRGDAPPVAYSYVRFSHPDQARGDSLRRQVDAAAEWCRRNDVRLDTSTTFRDLGRSAYTGTHRTNPDRHALAAFLKLVEAGKVPRGSLLIIENLDRLSREHIQPALLLALNLLQAGVRIVQLKPAEIVFDDRSDTLPVMMMMMELSRGHGESAIKSERCGEAWARKRGRAREGREVMTRSLPAWVEETGGKLALVPARAAVVKRIFALAATGYGVGAVVSKLTAEGVPPFGPSGRWARSYVANILRDRRAVGECRPRSRRGAAADTAPIPGYFPAAVSEEEFRAARAGAAQRRHRPGRLGAGDQISLFAGLVTNALDGDGYYAIRRARTGLRVLVNSGSTEGRTGCRSFPLETFERTLLSLLAEVDPREVTGREDAPDEVMVLSGELARVEAKVAELEAELLNGDVAALANVLRKLEGQKRDLVSKLSEARQKASHPLSEAWGETHSLLAALDAAPDQRDARLRLRSTLRKVVEDVRLLVIPRGRDRVAAVQVWFAGDGCRNYLILHRAGTGGSVPARPPRSWVRSLAEVVPGKVDLRTRKDVRSVEAVLLALDLSRITGG
jgi:DNA invertase Pin-like site-specific DNA recombinase